MSDLLGAYAAHGPGHDEMLQAVGDTRDAWQRVVDHAGLHTPTDLTAHERQVSHELRTRGLVGPDAPAWPLDALPVVIGQEEWTALARATTQRLHLLDALLADIYGPRRLLGAGGVPPELVLGVPGFLREVDQHRLPTAHQLICSGVDVARNADGSWVALTDRTDAVGGLGLAMENRRIVSQVLAASYRAVQVRRLGPFFRELRRYLEDLDSGCTVLLSTGPSGPRAFDDAALAELLGVPLVQAEDLVVDGDRLWLQTLERREQVHVVLRAVPGARSDPLELRPGFGVPGLVHAVRHGGLHVVNPLGSAVLENPAMLTHLPRLARTVLGEELLLPSAATYWCGERTMGSHVIANLGRLVIKSTLPGHGAVRGWELTIDERAELSTRIAAQPWAWVGQEPVRASTSPTADVGRLSPAPTVLRLFGAAGPDGYQVLPGGLGRVLPAEDDQVTALPLEGTAKDIWVVATGAGSDAPPREVSGRGVLAARSAAGLARLGWHSQHAGDLLRLHEAAASAPESIAAVSRRVLHTTRPLADDVAQLLASARQARGELPPGSWSALTRLEVAVPPSGDHSAVDEPEQVEEALSALRGLERALTTMGDARRRVVSAGSHLARAQGVVAAVQVLRGSELAALLQLLEPDVADARPAARLLWDPRSPVSLRHHLTALQETVEGLPLLGGSRVPALLADVSDVLDELAQRAGVADADVRELGAAQWRLEEVRRIALTPVALQAADLPGERWAT